MVFAIYIELNYFIYNIKFYISIFT